MIVVGDKNVEVAGVEMQDPLGHSSLAIVMRYAHLSQEHLRSPVSRLERMLTPAEPAVPAHDFVPAVENPLDVDASSTVHQTQVDHEDVKHELSVDLLEEAPDFVYRGPTATAPRQCMSGAPYARRAARRRTTGASRYPSCPQLPRPSLTRLLPKL